MLQSDGLVVSDPVSIQRAYYQKTANEYDAKHVENDPDQAFALAFMIAMVEHLNLNSILDIGSGTGRVILAMASKSNMRVVGVEPSAALRAIGHKKGIPKDRLIDGDAQKLSYADGEFDLVCAFGALHHIPDPNAAVAEMLRVASKAIFISDSNNFGQGPAMSRLVKQFLRTAGLWKAANFLKTRGRGYTLSDGDGVAYSYSVFSNHKQIRNACKSVHICNTQAAGINPYRTAPHIALLGIK